MQAKPTMQQFKDCQEVLEFMQASIKEHEPYALQDLNSLAQLLEANTFDPRDYEAVSDEQ